MNTKLGLILCAGMGTRMGVIGKDVPKPLWPLFKKTLLDWQIEHMLSLGIEKIYVNVHHGASLIKDHLYSNWKNVISILEEPTLLNVGGAVANLKRVTNEQGALLVVTADMLSSLDRDQFSQMEMHLNKSSACLLAMSVEAGSHYNKIAWDEQFYLNFVGESNKESHTFSGISLIDLASIEPAQEPMKFFGELLDYKSNKISVYQNNNIELYDFGTLLEYVDSSKALFTKHTLNSTESIVLKLLEWGFLEKGHKNWTEYFSGNWAATEKEGLVVLSHKDKIQEIELGIS